MQADCVWQARRLLGDSIDTGDDGSQPPSAPHILATADKPFGAKEGGGGGRGRGGGRAFGSTPPQVAPYSGREPPAGRRPERRKRAARLGWRSADACQDKESQARLELPRKASLLLC